MTFQIVEAVLSADVAASGTVTLPYPGSSAQADFDPAGAHLANCAGADYADDDSDFSLTFGGSTVTFTNGGSNVTLPKGAVLRVQMIEFTPDITGDDVAFENIDAGRSGQAGTIDVFPSTASKGKLRFSAADSAGDTVTEIKNASQAAARTLTIPDPGASAASFVMDKGGQSPVLKDVDAGASGDAGSVDVFPSTASKGKIAIEAADSAGDYKLTLTNASQAAARTYTIPDVGADVDFVMQKGVSASENETNKGTSAATSVKEYGDGFNHVTVLTCTALAIPAITEGGADAQGDLIYSFPGGAVILEAAYFSIALELNGTDQDGITADCGLGTTIATGSVATLDGTPGFEDFLSGQAILCDGVAAVVAAKQPTAGGPMFIATGDDHTLHFNIAATWAAQSDGDGIGLYTGTVVLVWKFLE